MNLHRLKKRAADVVLGVIIVGSASLFFILLIAHLVLLSAELNGGFTLNGSSFKCEADQ